MSLPYAGLDPRTTQALGWTLVHFLWQGALLAAALSVADVALARAKATARYLAACLAFAAMLLAPLTTFFVLQQQDAPVRAPVVTAVSAATDAPISNPSMIETARSAAPVARTWTPARGLSSLSRYLPWVVLFWTAGVVLLSLRLIGGWWLVRRLARSSSNVALEAWQSRMRDLAGRLGVSRPVRLCRSALVQVPTAVGWLRPVILLPASTLTGLSPAQIEAILAHELAHVRRHDYLVNLVQSVAETLLFYHPAVWWVSRRIRDERELCCDELAIRVAGDPVSYARALYELERMRGESMALAMAATGGSLATRIARLLGLPGRPWETATRGLAGLFGAMAVLALLALGGFAETNGKAIAAPAQRIAKASEAALRAIAGVPAVKPELLAEPLLEEPLLAEGPLLTEAPDLLDGPSLLGELSPEDSADPGLVACDKSKEKHETQVEAGSTEESVGRFSKEEWDRIKAHGGSEEYVRRLDALLPDLSCDEICRLASHGVSSIYVANVRQAGLDVSCEDMIRLASNGVTSKYIGNVREAGLERASVDDLVRLHANGVSSAFIRGIQGMDPDDVSVDDLIRLSTNGVTSTWFSAMQWMGLSEFSVDQAIQLRSAGVSASYANKLKLATRRKLSLDEIKTLGVNGVSSDYVAKMNAVFPGLEIDDLVKMHTHGVSTEYAQQMKIAIRDIEVEAVVQLYTQGVKPDYAYEMARLGRLDTQELIRLYQNGVSAEFLDRVREAGYEDPSVDEVIRLHQRGLPVAKDE